MTLTGWDLTRTQAKRYEKLFHQAARSATLTWRNGQEDGYKDLANDLWVRVLESPGTQTKLESLSNNEVVATLKKMAVQLLSKEQGKLNLFREAVLYSSDNVKDALKGKSTNWALIELLPEALKLLDARNQEYSDVIKSRYLKGVVPPQGKEHVKLVRALKSLTEIINAQCISTTKRDSNDKLTVKDGPGSRTGKFPQDSPAQSESAPVRRGKGQHSDPTAAQALAILCNPEIKDELLYQTPITEITSRPRQVVFLPDGRRYRLSSEDERQVAAEPTKVFDIMQSALGLPC